MRDNGMTGLSHAISPLVVEYPNARPIKREERRSCAVVTVYSAMASAVCTP